MEDGNDGGPPIIYVLAGCIAGAIEAIATWPTEYIKTKLQLEKQRLSMLRKVTDELEIPPVVANAYMAPVIGNELDKPTPLNQSTPTDLYSNDIDCFSDIATTAGELILDDPPDILLPYTDMISGILYTVKTLGFFALYYGLTPTLIGAIPKAGIRFGMFTWLCNLLSDDDGNLSLEKTFLAGCVAGVVEAILIVVPIETIKTKCIQMDRSFLEGLKEIIVMEGMGGIYTGGLATVIKQSSNHGLRFMWYSEYKRMVTHDGIYALTPALAFFGGMSAGIFSAMLNQPADVVKTRMQGVRAEYTSTWDCIRQTYSEEGLAGFYIGIVPRLSRVIPGQGIIFLSYEMIVSALLSFYT